LKSLMLLWQRMAADAAVQCCTSASLDLKRIKTRYEHEGIGVLTLSLPEIGKAFERSLSEGRVTDDLLSLTGSQARFPVFLRNFFLLVFERDGGLLLDNPSVTAIQAIRQLTLAFSKVLLPCSDTREERAFAAYVECEQSLKDTVLAISSENLRDLQRISSMLFRNVFTQIDRIVYEGGVVPRHGPGSTAEKLLGNKKFKQLEWTDRLESIFPAMENLIPSFRYHQSLDELKWLDPGSERPVRVVSVPKTLKTPRIIAIEPTCMQYMQQGLMELFVKYLESDSLVQDMVGFTDQKPNQLLAQEGSLTGELATLDLSEASDRVSLRLVSSILHPWHSLFQAVLATRSTRADVPGHGIVPLFKFASMGSALTFPMEEIAFLAIIFYAVEQKLGRRLTFKDIASLKGRVRVYGDDLIVPTDIVPNVVSALNLFGFKVNRDKSHVTGRFRESCGKEYFDGHDVSIYRVRRLLPSRRSDAPEVISAVSLRNQAYWSGYWGVADYLDDFLRRLIPLPNVAKTSSVLGRQSVLGYSEDGFDKNLQRPKVKGMVVRTLIPASPLDDEWALLKFHLKRGREPYASDHLERQGRPWVVGITLRWACPF
jgi:hypothetical protein